MTKHRASKKSRKKKPVSHNSPIDKPTRKVSLFLFGIIFCVAIVVVFITISLLVTVNRSQSSRKLSQTNIYSDSPKKSDQASPPTEPNLTVEQKVDALKAEDMQLAQQLLKDFPRNDVTLAFVGSLYRQHGNNTEAVKLLNEALALNPNRADVYNALGGIAFTMGSYEEAIVYLSKALEIDTGQPGFRSSIAFSLMALGRYTEAIEQLKDNVNIFPESVYSHFLLGQAYLQQRKYDDAREHYLTAIKLDQNYVSAYYGLFTACSRLGRQEEADKYMAVFKKQKAEEMKAAKTRDKLYDDLVLMRKTAGENYIFAARIYQAGGRVEKAKELLLKAVTLDPKEPIYLTELAGLYSATNRPAEALKIYKKISEIEPQNPAFFFNVGVLSVILKRFDDAEEAFRNVIKLAPEDSRGYRELGWFYLSSKKSYAQARQLAEKAVKLENTADNYYLLACACEMDGDNTNALKAAERAVQLDPENAEYKKIYQRIKNR